MVGPRWEAQADTRTPMLVAPCQGRTAGGLIMTAECAPGARRTIAVGFALVLALFALLSACETRPASAPQTVACMKAGEHCEYDNQCCSERCYHETGCAGGTP